jgi:hypothetical protein
LSLFKTWVLLVDDIQFPLATHDFAPKARARAVLGAGRYCFLVWHRGLAALLVWFACYYVLKLFSMTKMGIVAVQLNMAKRN